MTGDGVRVVHVCKVDGVAGAEGHLLRLLPGLVARGLDVRMLVLGSGPATGRFREELAAGGVEVERVPIRADADLLTMGSLWKRLRTLRPQLVHTHLIHADLHGQAAASLAGVPLRVTTRHNTDPFRRRAAIRALDGLVLARVDRVVAISRAIARFVVEVERADPRKVRTVPYGLDPSGAPPAGRDAARRVLGAGSSGPLVGVFGRAVPQKGIEVLIDAFPGVRAVHPSARLVVVGDGPLRPALERRARTAGLGDAALFTGWVESAAGLMSACDVVVIPSLWEGFGLVALEAMAASRPIVASRVDGLEEIVVDGATGLLVTPQDVRALSGAVASLLGDPTRAAALGAAGFARLEIEYPESRMVEATLAVYSEHFPAGVL